MSIFENLESPLSSAHVGPAAVETRAKAGGNYRAAWPAAGGLECRGGRMIAKSAQANLANACTSRVMWERAAGLPKLR